MWVWVWDLVSLVLFCWVKWVGFLCVFIVRVLELFGLGFVGFRWWGWFIGCMCFVY